MNRPRIAPVLPVLPLLAACAAGSPGDLADDGTGPRTTGEPTAGDTSDAAIADDATIVEATLPDALACGAGFTASVAVRNRGAATWSREAGYKLGAVGDADPFHADTRVWLPADVRVAPGEAYTFTFELTAPAQPGAYVTDWQMVREGVRWFGDAAARTVQVTCDPATPGGLVRLEGRAMADDDGPFNALGVTMMWAAWAYKYDRPRLEANLQYLSERGFDYIRALGVVGDDAQEDYWDGREIDWRWDDYEEVIAGLTDLAHDQYGLRVEWTLIGDGQKNIPDEADRYALVDTFVAIAAARPHKVIHFELANEAWQNGFDGEAGLAQLRDLTAHMQGASEILVAASAPAVFGCADVQAIYGGGVGDLATIHFDRDIGQVEGPWRPVWQPWEHQFCAGVPPATNNEPIGPGSSVAEDSDPLRLVSAAIVTYVAGLPAYVFHTDAGVRGDQDLWEMPAVDAFVHLRALLPPGLAGWDAKDAHWPDSPFVVYAGDGDQLVPDAMWVDVAAPTSGVVRAYAAVRDRSFVALPIGILGGVTMAPRRPVRFDVFDLLSGELVDARELAAGEMFELSGAEALLIRGEFLDG